MDFRIKVLCSNGDWETPLNQKATDFRYADDAVRAALALWGSGLLFSTRVLHLWNGRWRTVAEFKKLT